eukprot:TRINITY_DN3249_c0_g1_i4.p1 TRINITY_DN3249_c0_g1~~TRINITY_DN3249_c0_g1_i4.p1  ORF type:complete len:343 (-),score=95.51 TRINITY_DN3249_c0_g1_i4:68-1066(-)
MGGHLPKILKTFPEFSHQDMPAYDVIEWETPLDSSDFSPSEWVRLAEQVEENIFNYEGFVILHGTDTMAYTASALSFMLENLSKPVIVTGAQVPLGELHNDAKRNLIISMLLAANFDIPEVCLFFNLSLYRGNRTKKIDSWGIDAFRSPNFPPLAVMGTQVSVRHDLILPAPKRRFRIAKSLCTNINVLQAIPGFDDSSLLNFCQNPDNTPKGLVLALYGTGNAPTRRKGFIDALAVGRQNGVEIVVTSQCLRGSVNLSSYATGIQLRNLGLIDGHDMTIEACVTKLAYLMGHGLRGAELKEAMERNLRGEVTPSRRNQQYNMASQSLLSSL